MNANDITPSTQAGVTIIHSSLDSTQNPTTKFADDTIGYEAELINNNHEDSFVSELTSPSSQTIIDFLQRPSIITSGTFGTSDSGIMWGVDATAAITPNKFPKMANIYTYKADFEFTLQVNADRMQQGRYILFFLPYGGILPASAPQINQWKQMHTCNLMKISQLPHIEIDLATQTHATLKIPTTTILPMLTWSTVSNAPGQMLGMVGLFPYVPLNPGTGGSTTCGYTIWGSLQNIQIGSTSVSQMDAGSTEAKAQGVGPVSGALNKVSKAIGVWGKVPIIGNYASQLAWGTRLMAQSAEFLGFSKPLAVDAPTRIDRKVAPYIAVGDKPSYAKPLGMIAENSVAMPSRFKGLDEMSIDFIKKVPAYFANASWLASAIAGTALISIPVTPLVTSTWSKGTVYTPTGMLATQFALYRGSMTYKFKLVKTGFHRGRLCVAFVPGPTPYVGNLNSTEFVFREIVDVSTTGEFSVCCPYLLPRPWSTSNTIMGTMVLFVVDPLVAPNTVSTTVSIVIEVVGGDDLQFAVPNTLTLEPYAPSTFQMAESYEETECMTLGPKIAQVSDPITMFTIGEPVRSIRSLLKRAFQINSYQPALGSNTVIQHFPYLIPIVTQANTTSGALQRDVVNGDPISIWSCAYAFSYGSMRLFVRPIGTGGQTLEATYVPGGASKTSWYTGPIGFPWFGYKTFSPFDIEGIAEFQTPNWNVFLGRSNTAQLCNNTSSLFAVEATANLSNLVLGDSGVNAAYNVGIARAIGEDFGLSMFIGLPPLVSWSTS